MSTKTEMILSERTRDPLIEAKRKQLERIERMAARFKRIDIEFLQMTRRDSVDIEYPVFAIMPLEEMIAGETCEYRDRAFYVLGRDEPCFAELMKESRAITQATAKLDKSLPATIRAEVEEVRNEFDEVWVVWEADWAPAGGDPLVIGQIADLYFLVAQWDTTRVESYVAGGAY